MFDALCSNLDILLIVSIKKSYNYILARKNSKYYSVTLLRH